MNGPTEKWTSSAFTTSKSDSASIQLGIGPIYTGEGNIFRLLKGGTEVFRVTMTGNKASPKLNFKSPSGSSAGAALSTPPSDSEKL